TTGPCRTHCLTARNNGRPPPARSFSPVAGCDRPGGMARRRSPEVDEIAPAQIEAAEAAVRRAGAVAVKKLLPARLTRRAEADLVEALARRGLERTPRVVRVPLDQQLREVLGARGELTLTGLGKQLAGVTAAEARRAALALARAGEAALVKEGRRERLLAVD